MFYRCTITAAGYSDYVVPMRSFQMRLRQSPLQCYLQVVIPRGLFHADEIAARKDGEITITEIDEDGNETDILASANISTLQLDEGARERSITLVAYKQITFPATGSHAMPHVTYRGGSQVRGLPVTALKPGDEVIAAGETFEAETVIWNVDATGRTMEVSGRTDRMYQIRLKAAAGMSVGADVHLTHFERLAAAADISLDAVAVMKMERPLAAAAALSLDVDAPGIRIGPREFIAAPAMSLTVAAALTNPQTYLAKVLGSNPVGFWRMIEASGDFENLASGGSYPASHISGTVSRQHTALIAATPSDKGAHVTNAVITVDTTYPNIQYPCTFMVWYKPESIFYANVLGRKASGGDIYDAVEASGGTSGGEQSVTSKYRRSTDDIFGSITSSNTFAAGVVQCRFMRLGVSLSKLFCNGTHYSNVAGGYQIKSQSGTSIKLGRNEVGYAYGVIQDIAIWDRELSNTEIDEIYAAANTAP